MSNGVLKFGLVGMDYRSMSLFNSTISEYLKTRVELVNITLSDIAVFDMDNSHAKEQLSAFKTLYPKISTLAISTIPLELVSTPVIQKPIDFRQLIMTVASLLPLKDLIWQNDELVNQLISVNSEGKKVLSKKQIAEQINSSHAGKESLVPTHYNLSNIESKTNVFDPKLSFYSTVIDVVKEARVLSKFRKISLWNQKCLIVNPAKNEIITDMSNGVLRSVCLATIDDKSHPIEVSVTNEKRTEQDLSIGKFTTYNIESLLWLMSILTSRGRIPMSVDGRPFDSASPVYLLHWPNITRLEPIPHAINIASLWIKQPRTLQNLSETLNVDQKHVNNFFVATQALGLAGQAKRPGDVLFKPSVPDEHQKRGLFSAVLRKLNSLSQAKATVAVSR